MSNVCGLQVGANKDAIHEARLAIVEILKLPGLEQETRRAALTAFTSVCEVKGATVSGCNFQVGISKSKSKK